MRFYASLRWVNVTDLGSVSGASDVIADHYIFAIFVAVALHEIPSPFCLYLEFRLANCEAWDEFTNPRENSPLWKRVIAWERSRVASGYGIIWGDADRNKQEEFSAECHSVDCF